MSYDPQTRRDDPTSQSAGRSASASTRSLTVPAVAVVAWLRVGEPIPDGWRVAAQRATHHHRHAFLIEKVHGDD
jgi:hypothetical protein